MHHRICIQDEDFECLELPESHPHIIQSNDSPRKNGSHEWNEDVRHPGHIKGGWKKVLCFLFLF